jgi:hypothetical protein
MGEQIAQSPVPFSGTAALLMASGKEISVHGRSRRNHISGKVQYFKAVDEQIPVSVRTANWRLAKFYHQVDRPAGVQSSLLCNSAVPSVRLRSAPEEKRHRVRGNPCRKEVHLEITRRTAGLVAIASDSAFSSGIQWLRA